MRHWLAYIILLILPLTLSAQEPDTMPLRKGPPSGAIPQEALVKQRLMSARKPDTTIVKISRQWTLSADFTTEIPVPLDTAFSLFNRYRLTDDQSDFNAYLGNYGLPLYQINFFDRDWNPDRFLYSYYQPFMHTPSNTRFVNTRSRSPSWAGATPAGGARPSRHSG